MDRTIETRSATGTGLGGGQEAREIQSSTGQGANEKKGKDVPVLHDVYLRSKGKTTRFPAEEGGGYGAPQNLGVADSKARLIASLADPGARETPERPRGPAFATLPMTEEPGSASVVTCYLINPDNLINPNPYTAEEWTRANVNENANVEVPDDFELVIAAGKGRVYHLQVGNAGQDRTCVPLSEKELRLESDLWSQLRNGTVVGRVLFKNRVVPLVNVASLQWPSNGAPSDGGTP